MIFANAATATLKMREADSTRIFSILGVNSSITDPEDAAIQVNKIFFIGGLSVIANEDTKLVITKEARDE